MDLFSETKVPLVPCTQVFQFHRSYPEDFGLLLEQHQNRQFLGFYKNLTTYSRPSHHGAQFSANADNSVCTEEKINYIKHDICYKKNIFYAIFQLNDMERK